MTWIEAARGPFERLLEAERESGRAAVAARLEGLRLAYLDLRATGGDRPLAEGVEAARTKGPWVLWMLRQALSPPSFEPVRAAWNRGAALETHSLRTLAENQARQQLGEFFDFWVYGAGLPEYVLRRAEARPEPRGENGQQRAGAPAAPPGYLVTLEVENRGTGACPAPVAAQTEEGARHAFQVLAGPGERAELRFPVLTRPTAAAVDPEGNLLMGAGERHWMPVRVRRFRWF